MDHLIEDRRALLQAAREIHAERHGAQTFTPGTYLPLQEAGRRSGLNPNRQRYYDAIEELWSTRAPSSGTRARDTPGATSTTSSPRAA
jgi:hypothetical protein